MNNLLDFGKQIQYSLITQEDKKTIEFVLLFDKSGSMGDIGDFITKGFEKLVESFKKISKDANYNIIITVILFDHELETIYCRTPLEDVESIEYVIGGATALNDAFGCSISFIKNCHKNDRIQLEQEELKKEIRFNEKEDILEKQFYENEDSLEKLFEQNLLSGKKKGKYIRKQYTRKIYYKKEYLPPDVHIFTNTDGMENSSEIFVDTELLSNLVSEQIKLGWKFYCCIDLCLDTEQMAKKYGISTKQILSFTRDMEGINVLFKTLRQLIKYIAISGEAPTNWQDLLNENSPLFGIKDENIKNIFNEAKKLLFENENLLSDLEIYAPKGGYDKTFTDIYFVILKNLNRIREIEKDLLNGKDSKLDEILQIYLLKQMKHGKACLKSSIEVSTIDITSANLVSIGGLKNISQNIFKFNEFKNIYNQCIDKLERLESLNRKALKNDFVILGTKLGKTCKEQKEQINNLVEVTLLERRRYIEHSIQSSSNFIFGRDKNKKMNFLEVFYMKHVQTITKITDEILEDLTKMNSLYRDFSLDSNFKELLLNNHNNIKKYINDDLLINGWINQVQYVLRMDQIPQIATSQPDTLEIPESVDAEE